ncbi:hypothetical protein [Deinococcus puniceus]|uniref:Uncharacterized protein n=1 Tax=Deinococcus puniceus TaxID=1182568 RepID=A0A172T7B6_9DEIO|nr:hypothetical protein [Deinococcus puniceus]ANE42928.1 hypothetical protein SU48_03150 [Deinococcus puniceus]
MTRTRAPLNFKPSREMKILLILLLMVGLIGGWYVWTSSRTNNVVANGESGSGPVPVEGAPAGGEGSTAGGNTGAEGSGTGNGGTGTTPDPLASGSTGTPVDPAASGNAGTTNPDGTNPDGTVDPDSAGVPAGTVTIPTLPPLGNAEGTLVGPNGEGTTAVSPKPGGINPDTPLVLLPGVNPFRPLTVDAAAAGTTPAGNVTANTPPATNPPVNTGNTGSVANTDTSSGLDPLGTNGGALPISPIPGSGDTVPADSVDVAGGAFPLPTIPGADGNAPDDSGTDDVIITPGPPSVTPDIVTADNGGNGTGNSATGSNGTSNAGNPDAGNADTGTNGTDIIPVEPPLPPIKPPVAGVSVPGVNRVPNLTANAGSGGTGATSGANGTGTGAAGTGTGTGVTASLPTAAPRPGTPQVITELAPLSTGTPAETTRPLDQSIAARELAFNAVVLGPVNTAIFRSKDGFLVVSVGQTLPDSDIVIKEVTATSATLALGNDTQTLELDKR